MCIRDRAGAIRHHVDAQTGLPFFENNGAVVRVVINAGITGDHKGAVAVDSALDLEFIHLVGHGDRVAAHLSLIHI